MTEETHKLLLRIQSELDQLKRELNGPTNKYVYDTVKEDRRDQILTRIAVLLRMSLLHDLPELGNAYPYGFIDGKLANQERRIVVDSLWIAAAYNQVYEPIRLSELDECLDEFFEYGSLTNEDKIDFQEMKLNLYKSNGYLRQWLGGEKSLNGCRFSVEHGYLQHLIEYHTGE